MITLTSRLRHFYYRAIFDYYKTTEDYSRRLALGLDLNSNYYQEIFIDIPKDNYIYKNHGIQGVELYFGDRLIHYNGVNFSDRYSDKFYMTYQYNNFLICHNWKGFSCDFIIVDVSDDLLKENQIELLNYYYGMQFKVDMSDYKFRLHDKLQIKNYDCLQSIIKSKAIIPTKQLNCEINPVDFIDEFMEDYILLLADKDNYLKKYFSDNLTSGFISFKVPVSDDNIEWSIANVNRLIYLLSLYENIVKNKNVEDRIFSSLEIVLENISNNKSFYSLLSDSNFNNLIDENKLKRIEDTTGLKIKIFA